MHLSREEEEALDGKYGEALSTAYRILVAIGEAIDADRLIPIEWAHISGVNYNTIGDAGLAFLEDISKDFVTTSSDANINANTNQKKIKIRTTINPMGYDPIKMNNNDDDIISDEFIERQNRISKAYERIGVLRSYTCIPYEVFNIPKEGTQVSFAESNAAIYANSILGLVTNKESALSALASALTGKAPYSGLRLEECRSPRVRIDIKHDLQDELDYALLGYFAGKVNEQCIALSSLSSSFSTSSSITATNIKRKRIDAINAKALCSALGTSGSAGMFVVGLGGKESIEYTSSEAKKVKDELSTSENGDAIIFGSPQLGLNEFAMLNEMLNKGNKRFKKRCIIFCARSIYEQAKNLGYIDALEHSNADVYCDCCSCLTPLISKDSVDSVITNSVKAAYYLKNWNKVDVCLKSMKDIVREECI